VEAIALHSSARHGVSSFHYQAVAANAMHLIEEEQDLVRLINRVATIIQGDDPAWQDVDFDDFDEHVSACREAVQRVLNSHTIVVEKLQDVRDRTTFVHARKREFLAHLMRSFRGDPYQDMERALDHAQRVAADVGSMMSPPFGGFGYGGEGFLPDPSGAE
jgi:hypothetical protein